MGGWGGGEAEFIDHGTRFAMLMAMVWQQQLLVRSANEAAARITNRKRRATSTAGRWEGEVT